MAEFEVMAGFEKMEGLSFATSGDFAYINGRIFKASSCLSYVN